MTDVNTNSNPQPDMTGAPDNGNRSGGYPKIQYKVRPKVVKTSKKEEGIGKLTKLMDYLDSIKDQNFTGYIKVNFSQGSIGRIERFEEILRK